MTEDALRSKRKMPNNKILITGCARSGTSLLLLLMRYFQDSFVEAKKEIHPILSKAQFLQDDFNRRYSNIIIKRPQLSKTHPQYFNLQEVLDKDFKIIYIIRNGFDVLCSKRPQTGKYHVVDPNRWIAAIEDYLKHKDNKNICTIKYEDLVNDTEHCMSKISQFLNTPYSIDYMNFYKNTKENTPITRATHGLRPIDIKSIDNWKNHKEYLEKKYKKRLAKINELNKKFGYEEWK